jgi:Arc/MetJ family transcription regulator
MRTNIDIDDELLKQAMEFLGTPTKKATVEEALRRMVAYERQTQALKALRGAAKVGDDYKRMRRLPRQLDPKA